MKRTSTFLIGIIFLVMLSIGVIAASGRFPPEGPLAFIHEQIGLLVDAVDELRLESVDQQAQVDSQQDQICELYDLTGIPFPPQCITLPPFPCHDVGGFFCEDGFTCCTPAKNPPPCCLE